MNYTAMSLRELIASQSARKPKRASPAKRFDGDIAARLVRESGKFTNGKLKAAALIKLALEKTALSEADAEKIVFDFRVFNANQLRRALEKASGRTDLFEQMPAIQTNQNSFGAREKRVLFKLGLSEKEMALLYEGKLAEKRKSQIVEEARRLVPEKYLELVCLKLGLNSEKPLSFTQIARSKAMLRGKIEGMIYNAAEKVLKSP